MTNNEIPRKKSNPDRIVYLRKVGFYVLIMALISYYILAVKVIIME
jgi:hypothetical protein